MKLTPLPPVWALLLTAHASATSSVFNILIASGAGGLRAHYTTAMELRNLQMPRASPCPEVPWSGSTAVLALCCGAAAHLQARGVPFGGTG